MQYRHWTQVLILSITLHGRNFNWRVGFYFSKFTPDYQLVCLCLLGYLNDYPVPQCPQLWPTGHLWPWPLTVRKLPKQQWAFLLDEFHRTAHLNWAYGLPGFPSCSPHRSTGSYETYFSSPPRSKARFTIWPQKHSSPAKPDSLMELRISALCLAQHRP